jgi:integrase
MATDLMTRENSGQTIIAEIVPEYSGADYVVTDATLDRMKRKLTDNTRAAYDAQWSAFTTWCAAQGRVALPATPHTVVSYAGHLAELGRSASTMEQAWAAIVYTHRTSGHGRPSPEARDAYFDVITTHKRDRAVAGKRKRQSAPVTVNAVTAIVAQLDVSTLAGLRDRVVVVLGYSGTLRRSELASLDLADLRFTEDGLIVTVRTSKTDKQSAGEAVHLPYGSRGATCPVRTALAWLAALAERGITEGPLLRRVRRGDVLDAAGISGPAVNDIVKRLAATVADLPGSDRMTAHGLRAGGPTDMARKGVPTARIAEHGRWSKKSPTVMEYVRTADAWRDNPLIGIGL